MYCINFYPHYIILLRIYIKFETNMWSVNWKKKTQDIQSIVHTISYNI